MKRVGKAVIIDPDNKHLLMRRSDHPRYPNEPDLPGGTCEPGESVIDATIREVYEESAILLEEASLRHLYSGTEYSGSNTEYSLYAAHVPKRPEVTISWEHDSHDWVDEETFLKEAQASTDTFMHMAYDVIIKEKQKEGHATTP